MQCDVYVATVKFSVKPESQYNVIKGKTLIANCSARAASTVIWKIKGSAEWNDSRISVKPTNEGNIMTRTLKIINVNHSDAGNITCEAHDTYSKISETSAVFVYGTFNFVYILHHLYQRPASLSDIFEHGDILISFVTEKLLKMQWAKHVQS